MVVALIVLETCVPCDFWPLEVRFVRLS